MASNSSNIRSESTDLVDLQPIFTASSALQDMPFAKLANAGSCLSADDQTEASPRSSSGVDGTSILLAAMWPTAHLIHQLGTKSSIGKFQNLPVPFIADVAPTVAKYSKGGNDCYFACAEYENGQSRTANNAVCAAAFWLDLDCGRDKAITGKGYEDVIEAHTALKSFLMAARLPAPTHIVSSGGGPPASE